jgi:hypothetical protein
MTTLFEFDGYKMTLQSLGRVDRHGHIMVRYTFENPEGVRLFEGDDLGASPLHDPESLETAKSLLSFLTCKEGDVDGEYFDNYTPAQIEFRDSFDCESLQMYTLDDE